MFTCKQVSKALDKEYYAQMSWFRRISLRVHVALCAVCGRYNKQVMMMQDTCHHFKEHCENAGEHMEEKLDNESKNKLEGMIKDELNKSS